MRGPGILNPNQRCGYIRVVGSMSEFRKSQFGAMGVWKVREEFQNCECKQRKEGMELLTMEGRGKQW